MSVPFWMRPMRYNEPDAEAGHAPDGTPARDHDSDDGETADFRALRMESASGDRDAGKPDPRLADATPLDYARGPHSRPLDIDDTDEFKVIP
jgi:hypothetical protein